MKQQTLLKNMLGLAWIAMFISSGALVLVLGIMHGFEVETYKKLQNIHPDIIVQAPAGSSLAVPSITNFLTKNFPNIKTIQPTLEQQMLLYPKKSKSIPEVVAIKGIASLPNHTALHNILTERAHTDFKTLLTGNAIFMGHACAKKHNLTIGDTITLLYPEEKDIQSNALSLEEFPVTIQGIFKTGMDIMDEQLIIMSLETLQAFCKQDDISTLEITLKDSSFAKKTITQLQQKIPECCVYPWEDLYPAILSALLLERYGMIAIISLMLLIASIGIIAVISMHIMHKKQDIATLKLMGMADNQIIIIFMGIGSFISITASFGGIFCGTLLGMLIDHYKLIPLPDVYYASHLPIYIQASSLVSIFIITVGITLFASWYATQSLKNISINTLLRS